MHLNPETTLEYSLVALPDGSHSLRSEFHGETFHPQVGAQIEARCVYFNPMRLYHRLESSTVPFRIWDIGLGGAGNALNLIREHQKVNAILQLSSFDLTLEPLKFALNNSNKLSYIQGFESLIEALIDHGMVQKKIGNLEVQWQLHLCDLRHGFGSEERGQIGPEAILYDPYSPAKNPELWSLPAFQQLRSRLTEPCTLATYSRSTSIRVALLLAGFFVGRGGEVGEKEETTVAATHADLIHPLLDDQWLLKVRNSTNGEPMVRHPHARSYVSQTTWDALLQHPQFLHFSIDSGLPIRNV